MKNLTEANAFRAQLVVPEHRQLFDYWMECGTGRGIPCRSDIQPGKIVKLLPCISLIDVCEDIGVSTVRLAGTRLREIHDREITGKTIESLDWGDKREYWLTAYRRTVEQFQPTHGVVKGPRIHKEHMVHYWLRLPLRCSEANRTAMILGHDCFMPAAYSQTRALQIA